MGEILLSGNDIQWLKDTHLKGVETPEFKSAVIVGNEDCPNTIRLYTSENPLVTDEPVAVYYLVSGDEGYTYIRVGTPEHYTDAVWNYLLQNRPELEMDEPWLKTGINVILKAAMERK
jgi:hypothetical protein